MKRDTEQTEYRNAVFAMMREDGFSVRTSMGEAQTAIANKFKFTSDDLRDALNVASRAVQQHGATTAQINYIVTLCEKSGRLDSRTPNTLTKFDASMMIENLKSA